MNKAGRKVGCKLSNATKRKIGYANMIFWAKKNDPKKE